LFSRFYYSTKQAQKIAEYFQKRKRWQRAQPQEMIEQNQKR